MFTTKYLRNNNKQYHSFIHKETLVKLCITMKQNYTVLRPESCRLRQIECVCIFSRVTISNLCFACVTASAKCNKCLQPWNRSR